MHSEFVHLRTHSSYSLSEGAIKVDELVKLCVQNNMPAVALTDNGNLFASLEFSKYAADNGVQPILGCVLNINQEYDKHNAVLDKLLLIAKNNEGYKNLLKLVSSSFLQHNGHLEPHINFNDLATYSKGLIALVGSPDSSIGKLLATDNLSLAEKVLLQFKECFSDSLYIELMRHGLDVENKIEPHLIDFAYKHDIPLVATNDVYFQTRSMFEAHDALLCIADGRYISEDDRRRLNREYYFKSATEMKELFKDIPEAINNSLLIAKRCAIKAEEHPPMLPNFPTVEDLSEEEQLRAEARRGLEQRLQNHVFTPEMTDEKKQEIEKLYFDRLDYELQVIINMQFPGYFLIVSDFIRWSKRNGIPVGPGRGSGAGSVVAWSLQITDLDPIRFGLLFERFLNPERISMPDFDIDFCQDRRDEVIKYVQEKYGKDRVAQIITFGKLQARAVIRDVGRVLQMPYGQVDKISKMVPFNPVNPVTLSQAIEMEPMLKKAREEEEEIARLLDIALQLEGLNRHASTHAAGIVISHKPLEEFIPLYRDPKSDMAVIQYSMKYAEAAGLVKFDFLGLKTLTTISNCCKLIQNQGIEIDISKIPYDNTKTYQMLSEGNSVGVFQFESPGMRDSLRKLRPDSIEDLIALGALYRPGPMDNIPTYIACKHGIEEPDYLHPSLENILKETFGVIIYQEQVMQIAQVLAGYTLGAADLLRRAMGKKIKAEMDAQRELFVNGAVKNNVDKQHASSIFDLVAKFAGYGFNKSHAAAYAVISYQTAYLKANYPVEFFVASMNLEIDDTDKINIFQQEAQKFNIKILPPDINKSEACFSIEELNGEKAIRYGLGAVKNVGLQAMSVLVGNRKENGKFKDVFDVASRFDSKIINKRQLESLIKVGAFDNLHSNRRQLFESVEMLINYSSTIISEKASNQINLFGDTKAISKHIELPSNISDWPLDERLNYECDSLGFFLSGHPLETCREFLERHNVYEASSLNERLKDGYSVVSLAGITLSTKTRVSPRGRFMSVQFSDPTAIFEVSIFDDAILANSRELLSGRTPLLINAEARKDEGGIRLTAQSIMKLDEFLKSKNSLLCLWIDSTEVIAKLKTYQHQSGNTKIKVFVLTDKKHEIEIDIEGLFSISSSNIAQIRTLPGILKLKHI